MESETLLVIGSILRPAASRAHQPAVARQRLGPELGHDLAAS